ncbi:E3 ubiquitin-protein ligase UPL4 [Euphorbia peplus]|nr:E3 ubiquitin-protein ligase UPL4 [Euphorbia peplus]
MGNRGHKRAEIIDELPADKRACSSLEFRPSSSNSSIQTNVNSTNSTPQTHDADMETSSSGSASSHSEEEDEQEREESAYGSCDSDDAAPRHNNLRNLQRQRSSGDHAKLRGALTSLTEGTDPSAQLAALTELCEVLSFSTEDSLSSTMADSLAPVLVQFARHDSNPDIMLLAIRALTYLCDVFPRASTFLVKHDAVPVLCQRLMAIEYLDVAEQCLQALEKISREQPLVCLQGGAIMAVLSFIDFFSTSVQRVALSTVVNICKKLPTECPSCMEVVPILCNLLQYEDQQLVENVVICLMKIAERVSKSSEMLDELCKHGLISQAMHLIDLNSRTTLSQPIYNGLIELLAKLSSGSTVAFRTLHELNISRALKDILASYDVSHGMSSLHAVDGHGNQVHGVLKLLNELLPHVAKNQDSPQEMTEKESFVVDHPDLMHQFSSDILPMLVQVVNTGANLYVCYGCLSVMKKLVYYSKPDVLVELLRDANIPSFLAGVFSRKDHHVLILALQIAEIILQKLSDVFLNSFVKEGVFFAIDALMMPEKCSGSNFPVFNSINLSSNSTLKPSSKVVLRCLCYAFDTGQSSPISSEEPVCSLEKDSVQSLAKHIKTTYFVPELCDSENGLTDILQKLKSLSASLSDLKNVHVDADGSRQDEESFYSLLHQIMGKLNGKESVSTFEFIESGIVKSLADYVSNGQYLEKVELDGRYDHFRVAEKRFEVFARLFSSYSTLAQELPVSILVRKLHGALSSLENFPVILSHSSKQRNWFATVPNGRSTSHPCLRVRFLMGEGETCLSDYSNSAVTVDPFSTLDAIEGFLLPKVTLERTNQMETADQDVQPMDSVQLSTPNVNSGEGETSVPMQPDGAPNDMVEMQASVESIVESPGEDMSRKSQGPGLSDEEDGLRRLAFYLEGQELDRTLTLYQAILQQKMKANHEITLGSKLWSHVYTLKYRISVLPNDASPEGIVSSTQNSCTLDNNEAYMRCKSFLARIFNYELSSELDKSNPTYDVLFLLKSLEGLNRFAFHLMSCERVRAFSEGLVDNLDDLKVVVHSVSQNEFVSSKLTEKLEQQMRDSLAVSVGGMPLWCSQLMAACPFLFSFEVRCKYFRLSAFGPQQVQPQSPSHNSSGVLRERRSSSGSSPRKKFVVSRDQILVYATQMMDLYAQAKVPIEVVYREEVGSGLGPTLEFYTLVSQEFQKSGLGMWREDRSSVAARKGPHTEDSEILVSSFGLFPCPWPSTVDTSNDGKQFSEVIKKFFLLGKVVAKALQDGRVLDLPFSNAFFKLILQQELNLYDIQSFDPKLGRTLLEFQAIINREKRKRSVFGESSCSNDDAIYRDARIEDLCLDFTLPGYPDYRLHPDHKMVNMDNLEEYVSLVVNATLHTGISRQVEAFMSGFDLVFPIKHLQIFTEEELERLLCGECDILAFSELLDHVKFDHGYTVSSPPITNLLEIMQEFNQEQRRAFLQFVTGAPRLPPGGLASLNPKLTIVRKHCSNCPDADLPSVMTCANYLKLPPYSSKERMKEKLLFAVTEGQGSFHLS